MDLANPLWIPPVEIFLDSTEGFRRGNDSFHNDVTFQLSRTIHAPEDYTLYLTCLSYSQPVTCKIINIYNNSVSIDNVYYTVPEGNYSALQLSGVLTSILPGIRCRFDRSEEHTSELQSLTEISDRKSVV